MNNLKTTKTIKSTWTQYEKVVATGQLMDFGIIFLDEYGCPIDDEYETNELYSIYKSLEAK